MSLQRTPLRPAAELYVRRPRTATATRERQVAVNDWDLMKTRRINADKPYLWKADIAASVDRFNQWFMRSIETRRQAIQAALDAGRSDAERNRLGQFATPNALAIEIAHYVKSVAGHHLRAIRFADPAIGTGSFYSAALAVFGPGRIESAVGVELDSGFYDAARDLWAEAGLDVVRGDFTRIVASSGCPVEPNLVLANPPYVRHHHLEREDTAAREDLQGADRTAPTLCTVTAKGRRGCQRSQDRDRPTLLG